MKCLIKFLVYAVFYAIATMWVLTASLLIVLGLVYIPIDIWQRVIMEVCGVSMCFFFVCYLEKTQNMVKIIIEFIERNNKYDA